MKKHISLVLMLCASFLTVGAQNKGGISSEMLSKYKQNYKNTAYDKAVSNAMGAASINMLALNQENLRNLDTNFSIEVKSVGITNQQRSGRCWLFTGLNVLRNEMIQKYNLDNMEFSQIHLSFYDQLEKCNHFLQCIIDEADKPIDNPRVVFLMKHALNDGGHFMGVADLVEKYGLVPSGVRPETYCSNHTSNISMLLGRKIKEFALELRKQAADGVKTKQLVKNKEQMMATVYKMLVLAFGEPVETFKWALKDGEEKEYTPLSFYKEYLDKDMTNRYVMFMNDPTRPYYKLYDVDLYRHVYDGHDWVYINLPNEDIKEMCIASLKDNTMMYISCDVNQFRNPDTGTLDLANYDYESLLQTTFNMDKAQRINTYDSGSAHAMTLNAVDIKDGKPVKWMVENSWGATNGFKGHLIMTDEWFDEYMFRFVIDKKYIPAKIMKILKQKPVVLPPWDPMF